MTSIERARAYLLSLFALSACAGQSADVVPGTDGSQIDGTGPEGRADCVSVGGTALEPWFDVDVVGTEFDSYDGRRVRVVVALNYEASRFGVAETTIREGAFSLAIPATRSAAFTEVGVYVDENDSDGCDVGEPTWTYATPGAGGDLSLAITPSQPAPLQVEEGCMMNGWFNLAEPLPCSAE